MAETKPPKGTGPSGRRLWRSVVDDYELDDHETVLLREAVRVVDRLDRLAELIDAEGVRQPGVDRMHPALAEARQQQITLARLLAALRMPAGEAGDTQAGARPARRGAPRGTYGIRGVVS